MNDSANGFAGALFFTLVAIGAFTGMEDVFGMATGAGGALIAAVCLRRALTLAEADREENIQRMEIQMQQMRRKLDAAAGATIEAMKSVTGTKDTTRDDLSAILSRLNMLDNLQVIAETQAAVGSAMKKIEDDTRDMNVLLKNILTTSEEIFSAVKPPAQVEDVPDKTADAISELSKTFSDETKNLAETFSGETKDLAEKISGEIKSLAEISETNKNSLQAAIKIFQAFGQILKNPDFAKELARIGTATEKLNAKTYNSIDFRKSFDDIKQALEKLAKVGEEISRNNLAITAAVMKLTGAATNSAGELKEAGEKLSAGASEVSSVFEDVRRDLANLAANIDAYNGLTRATLDQYSDLTEQDVRLLEGIAEKIK